MFWERFVQLCAERNTKPNPVAKELGISSGAVTNWKNGAVPQSATLKRIADYFGVSTSYLLGIVDDSDPEESAVSRFQHLQLFASQLNPEELDALTQYAEFLINKKK